MAVRVVGTRNNHKSVIIISFFMMLIFAAAAAAGYYYLNRIEKEYKSQIADYKFRIRQNMRTVYVPIEDIKFKAKLDEYMFETKDICSSIPAGDYMNKEDFGKYAAIDVKAGTPFMKFMLTEEEIADDIREEEFNMLFLQSNLVKNDFVDIRICFPNGEDYIVISKKMIKDINLKRNTVWTWLTEKEILTISSAVVDAYLHKGSKLYVVKYVQPNAQKAAELTYPTNENVQKVMAADPNILQKAGLELAAQARKELDERLQVLSSEAAASITAGVNQDLSIRKEGILEQSQQQTTKEQEGNKKSKSETTNKNTNSNTGEKSNQNTNPKDNVNNNKNNSQDADTNKGSEANGFFN